MNFRQSAGQDVETVGPLWNHSHVGVSPMLTYNPNSRSALKWLHFCVGQYDTIDLLLGVLFISFIIIIKFR